MSKVLLVINGSNYGDAREVVECMSCKEDVCESMIISILWYVLWVSSYTFLRVLCLDMLCSMSDTSQFLETKTRMILFLDFPYNIYMRSIMVGYGNNKHFNTYS